MDLLWWEVWLASLLVAGATRIASVKTWRSYFSWVELLDYRVRNDERVREERKRNLQRRFVTPFLAMFAVSAATGHYELNGLLVIGVASSFLMVWPAFFESSPVFPSLKHLRPYSIYATFLVSTVLLCVLGGVAGNAIHEAESAVIAALEIIGISLLGTIVIAGLWLLYAREAEIQGRMNEEQWKREESEWQSLEQGDAKAKCLTPERHHYADAECLPLVARHQIRSVQRHVNGLDSARIVALLAQDSYSDNVIDRVVALHAVERTARTDLDRAVEWTVTAGLRAFRSRKQLTVGPLQIRGGRYSFAKSVREAAERIDHLDEPNVRELAQNWNGPAATKANSHQALSYYECLKVAFLLQANGPQPPSTHCLHTECATYAVASQYV